MADDPTTIRHLKAEAYDVSCFFHHLFAFCAFAILCCLCDWLVQALVSCASRERLRKAAESLIDKLSPSALADFIKGMNEFSTAAGDDTKGTKESKERKRTVEAKGRKSPIDGLSKKTQSVTFAPW